MPSTNQFATFFLNNLYFGIEVRRVQEVIRYQAMTQVPRAPAVIQGLINLRGQIVMAIDLRRRLDLPPRAVDALPMNVVVRADEGVVSLLVDEIGDVVDVDAESFELPPETLDGAARELIHGVYKLKSRLLLALDIDRVINLPAGITRMHDN